MTNFEAFHWGILSSIYLVFLRSGNTACSGYGTSSFKGTHQNCMFSLIEFSIKSCGLFLKIWNTWCKNLIFQFFEKKSLKDNQTEEVLTNLCDSIEENNYENIYIVRASFFQWVWNIFSAGCGHFREQVLSIKGDLLCFYFHFCFCLSWNRGSAKKLSY